MDYLDGTRLLTRSGWRGMGYVDTDNGRYLHEQINLDVGEYVYGLGERFTPWQVVDLWHDNGGDSLRSISFYLDNVGK